MNPFNRGKRKIVPHFSYMGFLNSSLTFKEIILKITLQKFRLFTHPQCDQNQDVGLNNLLNPVEFSKN